MTHWTAVVLAGSRPGIDSFAQAHGTDLKALIPVAGVPMVARPVEALLADPSFRDIRVLTQHPDRIAAVLPRDERLRVQASGATIAATLESLCQDRSVHWPVLVTTADHALLDGAMIGQFRRQAAGKDIAIAVVERGNLLGSLPQSRRTWLRFRGGAYSGANLFALGGPQVLPAIRLWRDIEQDRKKGARLLLGVGPGLLLGALLRIRTLDQSLAAIGRRLGLTMSAIEMQDPLAAVDVDKPDDHALVEAILAERA